jgi:plasmid stabilization system protein ParE
MAHRLAPEAAAELDGIWYESATASFREDIADRVVDKVTQRFTLQDRYPHIYRRRDDLRLGLRGFPAGEYVILHASRAGMF